ncbi:MAG: hypothetical protein U5J63_08810 [Fodinibius sp.]|nr:hypothetical protein [Fodinibius sp.]
MIQIRLLPHLVGNGIGEAKCPDIDTAMGLQGFRVVLKQMLIFLRRFVAGVFARDNELGLLSTNIQFIGKFMSPTLAMQKY